MKEVIFNLSKQKEIESEFDFDLIDIRYSIVNAENKLQKLVDLDLVAPIGLELYKNFIAKLVKDKELLSIKVTDFSVYWITDCAVKGYAWHWGRDFFLLIAILQEYQKLFEKNYFRISIFLSNEWCYLKNTLDSFFSCLNFRTNYRIIEVYTKKKSRNYGLDFLRLNKNILKCFLNASQLKPKPAESSNNLFFVSLNNNTGKDHLFNSTKKLYNQNHQKLSDVPYSWQCDREIPDFFHQHRPSLFQKVKLVIQLNQAFFKSIFLKGKSINLDNGLLFSTTFIKDDLLKKLIGQPHLFHFYFWLKRYFSSINKTGDNKIFFDDEFYQSGRIISKATSDFSNVKSYGLQHGHFMESHTVYVITQEEVDAGLPIPDQFISWGNHYSQIFLKHNKLSKKYVIPLGNPIYFQSSKKSTFPKEIKSILWCLTTKECMQYEWDIINKQISLLPWKLNIRLHPSPHILKSDVIKLLGDNVSFSFDDSPTVLDAMQKNDLILVSAHSTTFIDAISAKRHCIRLKSIFWDGGKTLQATGLYTVSSNQQFRNAIKVIIGGKIDHNNEVNFLETSVCEWNMFIAHN